MTGVGWRPWLLVGLAGLAWAWSLPPVGAWPLSFLVTALLGAGLHLADPGPPDEVDGPRGRPGPRAFVLGVAFGLAAFLPMIAWARNIEPGGLLAWPLLSLVEAVYLGTYAVAVRPALGRRWLGPVALSLGWVGLEVVRGSFPSGGFGWGEFSYAHVDGSWLTPLARIGGGHLITLVVALVGALLFESWRLGREAVDGLDGSRLDRAAAMLPHGQPPMYVLAGVLLLSVLATVEPPGTAGEVDVLVVQGNELEDPRFDGRALDVAIAQEHLDLTRAAIGDGPTPDLVVWPESAVDRDPWRAGNEDILEILREGAALADGGLLAGVRLDGPRPATFLNTVVHVDREGAPVEVYVKRNLVPFGEYVPLRSLVGGIGPLNVVSQDGVPGTEAVHLGPDDLRVAVAICFETLFSGTVRDNVLGPDGEPAGIIVAATNDASFGRGAEVDQHIDQSRLRAVETGRWVVHAAISGSSAIVDPQGDVLDRTDLFELATIRRTIPIVVGRTPYLATGDWVGPLGLAGLLAVAVLGFAPFSPLARVRSRAPAAAADPTGPDA